MEEKGDRQEVGSYLRFIAKLRRKLLRNQLNYKQEMFIIKKIVVFSSGKIHKWRIFQLTSPVILNNFHDELQKLGENSSLCLRGIWE